MFYLYTPFFNKTTLSIKVPFLQSNPKYIKKKTRTSDKNTCFHLEILGRIFDGIAISFALMRFGAGVGSGTVSGGPDGGWLISRNLFLEVIAKEKFY